MMAMMGGSVAEGGPRVLVCDGAPEGLSTGLVMSFVMLLQTEKYILAKTKKEKSLFGT